MFFAFQAFQYLADFILHFASLEKGASEERWEENGAGLCSAEEETRSDG